MSLFGRVFRVFTFGESHSAAVGCLIEGFPSNQVISLQKIQHELNRRRPGQSTLTTPRKEADRVECLSGLENDRTLGSPLCFLVNNENVSKKDYTQFQNIPRPGHADFTQLKKYGLTASSGGGRSSARETIGRVIAGALAKQYLHHSGITFASWVHRVNTHEIPFEVNETYIRQKFQNEQIEEAGFVTKKDNHFIFKKGEQELYFDKEGAQLASKPSLSEIESVVESANTRCPHYPTSVKIFEQIQKARKQCDSLGGIVQGTIYGLPPGLGNPTFDKAPALLAQAMLSIPAVKGFQIGSGFQGTMMKGSEHNDAFDTNLRLKTNHSGGTLGGITTGETLHYKVAFKPPSTIARPQVTSTYSGEEVTLEAKGRHDPCVLPRAPPIVDNMAAMVIMDLLLTQRVNEV